MSCIIALFSTLLLTTLFSYLRFIIKHCDWKAKHLNLASSIKSWKSVENNTRFLKGLLLKYYRVIVMPVVTSILHQVVTMPHRIYCNMYLFGCYIWCVCGSLCFFFWGRRRRTCRLYTNLFNSLHLALTLLLLFPLHLYFLLIRYYQRNQHHPLN